MKQRLPIMCPSNLATEAEGLYAEPCRGGRCVWWERGGCSAGRDTQVDFGPAVPSARPPECALAPRCRWHLDAGEHRVCVPRQLGTTCEHQGGWWNTFTYEREDR